VRGNPRDYRQMASAVDVACIDDAGSRTTLLQTFRVQAASRRRRGADLKAQRRSGQLVSAQEDARNVVESGERDGLTGRCSRLYGQLPVQSATLRLASTTTRRGSGRG